MVQNPEYIPNTFPMLCSQSALGGFPLKLFWREFRFTVQDHVLSEGKPQPEESVTRLRGVMRTHASGVT